jgi:hypothetical protein
MASASESTRGAFGWSGKSAAAGVVDGSCIATVVWQSSDDRGVIARGRRCLRTTGREFSVTSQAVQDLTTAC